MPAVATGNRIGNGLSMGTDENIVIPYNALFNLDLSKNFCIHSIVYPISPSGGTTPRYVIGTKRISGNPIGFDFSLVYLDDDRLYLQLAIYSSTGNRTNLKGVTIFNPLKRFLSVACMKYNSNPASSVSADEWYFGIDGLLYGVGVAGGSINGGPLTPSSVVASTNVITINEVPSVAFTKASMILYKWQLFDIALSFSQYQKLYWKDGIVPNEIKGNRIIDYQFDQKTGTTILDSSGNNINGNAGGFTSSESSLGALNNWVGPDQQPILI